MSIPDDLFNWLLSRKSPNIVPKDWQDSPDNWAAGDIAICGPVPEGYAWRSGFTGDLTDGPSAGDRIAVHCVLIVEGRQFLRFGKWPGNWYLSSWSRKARPQADEAKGNAAEWTEILRHSSQKVST